MKRPSHPAVKITETAEREQATGQPDPFPPEGTDERDLPGVDGKKPLSEAERVAATRRAIKQSPESH